MLSIYEYQPLDSPATQIRVLELLPGRGIIQCRLKVVDFQEAEGSYEPISYCWNAYTRKYWLVGLYKEKKQKTCRVLVDGASFHITKSLRAAFRHMRLKAQVRLLWADAICINQADDNEKSAQVARMGDIYRRGKRTLVWLGDADCWTDRAFRHLRLGSTLESEDSDSIEPQDEPDYELDYVREDSGTQTRHPRHLRQFWRSFQTRLKYGLFISIIRRPYFERAWIIQEVILSDSLVIMCGKHEITGNQLFEGISGRWRVMPTGPYLILEILVDLWEQPQRYCLDSIIRKVSHTKAFDPRDKLYSILGLHHQNCPNCRSMVVDYSKDVDEVFLEATKLLLSRSPFLDLLSMSYGSNRPEGKCVPSWVWNPEPRSTVFSFSGLLVDAGVQTPFGASQGWHSQPRFQDRMIGLLGYVFDDIRAVGKCLPAHTDYLTPRRVLECLGCYFSWVDVSGMYEKGITEAEAKRRMRVFRCTLDPFAEIYDTPDTWYSLWDDDEEEKDFALFHAEFMKRFGRIFSPGVLEASAHEVLAMWAASWRLFWRLTVDPPRIRRQNWDRFFRRWDWKAIFDRCFVRTENGAYALCPRGTKPNDRLVLLQGANVPIVLRPFGENWTLVGECYVYGVMYGELWDQDRCTMLWVE